MDRLRRDPDRSASVARPRATPGATSRSTLGFLLQLAAYAICFVFYRRVLLSARPYVGVRREDILAALAIALTIASVWFCYAAARALGRHWALMARVIEGHELISQGPYAIVRNPIYLAMLGMLIAIGLASAAGRRSSARLWCSRLARRFAFARRKICCARTFGAKFEDYARRVPAFLPRLWP